MDSPNHTVSIIETINEDPSIPPAYHAKCACGWAAESHDEQALQALVREHEAGGHFIPAPASPTPV